MTLAKLDIHMQKKKTGAIFYTVSKRSVQNG